MLAVMSLSLAVVGCGTKNTVDTSKLESSFKSSPPATPTDVDKAVSAIKDTIAAIQKQMGSAANKAAGDLQKSLPK